MFKHMHNSSSMTSNHIKPKKRFQLALLAAAALLGVSVFSVVFAPQAFAQTKEDENSRYTTQVESDKYTTQIENTNKIITPVYEKQDKYDASLAMAKKVLVDAKLAGGDDYTPSVILVTGASPLHAILIGRFAATIPSPIILVPPEGVTSEIIETLDLYRVAAVYVLGGPNFISDIEIAKVQSSDNMRNVVRIAAFRNTHQISSNLAERSGTPGAWCAKEESVDKAVFIVSEEASVDALIVLGQSVALNIPILATDKDTLSSSVSRYLISNRITTAVIIGDVEAVSPAVEKTLAVSYVKSVVRLGGATRYETALKVLDASRECFGENSEVIRDVVLVNGYNFDTALVTSPILSRGLGEKSWMPILLTSEKELPDSVRRRLQQETPRCVNIMPLSVNEVPSRRLIAAMKTNNFACDMVTAVAEPAPLVPRLQARIRAVPPVPTAERKVASMDEMTKDAAMVRYEKEETVAKTTYAYTPPEIRGRMIVSSFDENSSKHVGSYYRLGVPISFERVNWSLSGPDAAVFSLVPMDDPISVDLMFLRTPDYENPMDANRDNVYTIVLTVMDKTDAALSSSMRVIIQVVNMEERGSVSIDIEEDEAPAMRTPIVATLPYMEKAVDKLAWQWETSKDGVKYRPIPGARDRTYTPEEIIAGQILRAKATYIDERGKKTTSRSVPTLPIK